MKKIGITGGIGSGKTTISNIFKVLSIPVYDADSRAKQLMTENSEVKNSIIQLLGQNSYLENGALNRQFVGQKIFSNPTLRKNLNAIVHPAVHQDFQLWASRMEGAPYVLDEAALIFESGGNQHLDQMILVTAPVETRIERVIQRNNMTREQVIERVQAQWDDNKKLPMSDFVIVNDGNSPVIRQVLEIHRLLIGKND
jgi:dephospho-CoA kinase